MKTFLAGLLLRFVPHRTAIGVVLFVLAEVLSVFGGEQVCGAWPTVCAFAAKAQAILTPWLVVVGIRDKERKPEAVAEV